MPKEVFKRFEGNPILTPRKNGWEDNGVFNAGAIKVGEKIALVYRARGKDMISRLGLAWSDDGYNFERADKPFITPDADNIYEAKGLEDPRITFLDGWYNIVYVASSHYPLPHPNPVWSVDFPWRVRLSVIRTRDWQKYERLGVVLKRRDTKDPALFPEKIDNQLFLLHRIYPNVTFSKGKDWGNWDEHGVLLKPRDGMWDSSRVGANGPPIKTKAGWLLTYHATDEGYVYRIGAILLDLKNPLKILARSKEPFLEPETDYERGGDECGGRVHDIVFSCGMIQKDKDLIIYYGGADKYLNAGVININMLINSLAPV